MATIVGVGDIHLGRRPSRLPAALADHGLSPAELGPAAAWSNVVAWACREQPAAVLLAGDVVESMNARFEAWGVLRKGVEELAEAGVPVIGVAGNHDVEALPRLARVVDGFHLLGAGGQWELSDVEQDGRVVLRVLGWSFPARHVETTPIESLRISHDHSVPVIGVMHGDLDAAVSRYAPVRRSDLDATPVHAWFLGHIHRQSLAGSDRPIGYLGSLVGLDPSENGWHGAWLARTSSAGVAVEPLDVAPLRFEEVEIDTSGHADPGADIEPLIARALERLDASIAERDQLKAVGCRLRFTGESPDWRELDRAIAALPLDGFAVGLGGVCYFVHEVRNAARATRDLEALARGGDPPALLARDLLALETGEPRGATLVAAARAELRAASELRAFRTLDRLTLDDASIRDALVRAAREALEAMLEAGEAVP